MPSSPILSAPLPSSSDAASAVPQYLTDLAGALERSTVPRFTGASDRDAKIPSPVRGMLCWLDSPGAYFHRNASAWVQVLPAPVEVDRIGYAQRGYDGSNVYDLALKTITRTAPFLVHVNVTGEFIITGGGIGAYLQINQTGAGGDPTRARWFVQSNPGSGSAACHSTIAMPLGGSVTVKASLSIFANTHVEVYTDLHSKLETTVMPLGTSL